MLVTKIPSATVVAAALCFSSLNCAYAQNWKEPVWSDEFDARAPGTPPDRTKWTFDVGTEGWGNHEIETYCAAGTSTPVPCDAKRPNAYQDGQGHLVIQAIRTSPDPAPAGTWTSARLKTLGPKDFQYGRLETCMTLPVGAGLWPAYWMLGSHGAWPAGGEMDIMENVPATGGSGGGLGPTVIESTIHGPSSASPTRIFSLSADSTLSGGGRVDDKEHCHLYGMIWSPFMVQMYVDNWRKPFFIRTADQVPEGGRWVFNAPFHFILNLAVGGDWPGMPNATTPNPAQMLVDYVRVYNADPESGPKMSAEPITLGSDHLGSTTIHLLARAASGMTYLSCSTDSDDATCKIDTKNPLNAAVVDFGANVSSTAKLSVELDDDADAKLQTHSVTVTAYNVSGSQSTLKIPVR